MNKVLLTGIGAIMLATVFALPQATFAYQGNPAVKGPNYTAERDAAMDKAFESNDYDAWKKLMQGRGRVTQVITKDNFATFAKAHELADSGKIEEANALREQLGLKNGSGKGTCNGMGRNR